MVSTIWSQLVRLHHQIGPSNWRVSWRMWGLFSERLISGGVIIVGGAYLRGGGRQGGYSNFKFQIFKYIRYKRGGSTRGSRRRMKMCKLAYARRFRQNRTYRLREIHPDQIPVYIATSFELRENPSLYSDLVRSCEKQALQIPLYIYSGVCSACFSLIYKRALYV